ncbi:hypothetical protein F4778DRAFT_778305 [Xylariomycetidae sp. FL2044]|nr:hypothetical protein F4778DRAFT_778305 [Xylariomycetidae sp. FL2044]
MPSKASSLAQVLPFTLSSRTLYIKCTPAPRTFFERRAVLRALQQHTSESIETFKKLEDNSSFIAITSTPDAATDLVRNAPFKRTVVAENLDNPATRHASWTNQFDLRGNVTDPVHVLPAAEETTQTTASADLGVSHHTFTLGVFPANESYNHIETINRNPLHGPWPQSDTDRWESFTGAALRKRIPHSAMAPAWRDWESSNQLARDVTSFAEEFREGATHKLLGKKRASAREAYLMERIRQRKYEAELPEVMRSLAGFAEKHAAVAGKLSAGSQGADETSHREDAPGSSLDKSFFTQREGAGGPVSQETPRTRDPSENLFMSKAQVPRSEPLLDDSTFKDLMADESKSLPKTSRKR